MDDSTPDPGEHLPCRTQWGASRGRRLLPRGKMTGCESRSPLCGDMGLSAAIRHPSIDAVQHRSLFWGADASIQHSVPPSGDIVDP
jgi:hypothetical protein